MPFLTKHEVDGALVTYFDERYGCGDSVAIGWNPSPGKDGDKTLPRARKSVDPWERKEVIAPRWLFTWEHTCGLAADLAVHGHMSLVAYVRATFDA